MVRYRPSTFSGEPSAENLSLSLIFNQNLCRDFNEVVAAGYRPGILHVAFSDIVVSVSTPVINLVDVIPARALMAWDSRLLSKTHHLTLLISGIHSMYPVLRGDGTLIDAATKLQFRVGLTSRYKPNNGYVSGFTRTLHLKEL